MPAAKTGREIINRMFVIKMLQINKGIKPQDIIFGRQTKILVIKLTDLKIEEIPAKCKERIKKFMP